MMDYAPHELCLAFPEMRADEYTRLRADIKANGLNHPIVLFEGKILDGRHRFRACKEIGIKPMFREFIEGSPDEASNGDPVAFVQSENAARRNLDPSQIAFAMSHPNIREYESRKARERMAAGGGDQKSGTANWPDPIEDTGETREKLAEKAGVGSRTMGRAFVVRDRGVESLQAKVQSGEIKVSEAEKIARLKPEVQERIAAIDNRKERGAKLAESIARSEAAKITQERRRAPKVDAFRPKFAARFIGRLRTMQANIRDDMGDLGASGQAMADRVLAELSDEDMVSLEIARPFITACAILLDHANGHRAAA